MSLEFIKVGYIDEYVLRTDLENKNFEDVQEIYNERVRHNYNLNRELRDRVAEIEDALLMEYTGELGYINAYLFDKETGKELKGRMKVTFIDNNYIPDVYEGKLGDKIDEKTLKKLGIEKLNEVIKSVEDKANTFVYLVEVDDQCKNEISEKVRTLIVMKIMQRMNKAFCICGAGVVVYEKGMFKDLDVKWNKKRSKLGWVGKIDIVEW